MRACRVLIGDRTGAAAAYVGMTRGRERNVAHLVAGTLNEAKQQWIDVFSRDRADLGPAHAALSAAEDIDRYGPNIPVRRRSVDPPTRRPDHDLTYRPPAASPSRGIGF